MNIIAISILGLACLLLFISSLAFLKARNIFIMTHIAIISSLYITPLLLIGILATKFSWISFLKIMAIILLNILITHLISHAIIKRAMINKVLND